MTRRANQPARRSPLWYWGAVSVSAVVLIILIIFVPAIVEEFRHQRVYAKYRTATSRLSGVYREMYMYSLDHDGHFPTDLQTLAESRPIDLKYFRSPYNDEPIGPRDQVNAWADYAYVSGIDIERDDGRQVLMFTTPGRFDGEAGYVVAVDSMITGGDNEWFEQQMQQLAAELDAHPDRRLIIPPGMPAPAPLRRFLDELPAPDTTYVR